MHPTRRRETASASPDDDHEAAQMMSPEQELDDLRIHLDDARRNCDMRAIMTITQRIDHLIRNQAGEIR